MGNHIDTRDKRKKVRENFDDAARRRKASFKQYLRDLEEELLDEELEDQTELDQDD
jgi:hypothetical protein